MSLHFMFLLSTTLNLKLHSRLTLKQLVIHVVQNRHAGVQETHCSWEKTNKVNLHFKWCELFVCLLLVRRSLPPIMAVLYQMNKWTTAKGLFLRILLKSSVLKWLSFWYVFILYSRKAWVQILVKHLPMVQSYLYLLSILRCFRCCSGNLLPRILQRVWRWRTSDVCNLRVLWTRTSNHACCQGNKVKLCPTQIVQFRIRHGRWIKAPDAFVQG